MIAAAVPLVLLSACAQSTAAKAGPGILESVTLPAVSADTVVARVESYGGFAPVDRTLGRLPTVSIYGDGRVITDGPVVAIYPAPALPNPQVQQITPELVRELVRQAVIAGVHTGTDFGTPGVADAPTTRVTAVTDSGTQTVEVQALGEAQPTDPRLTVAQRDARTKLATFVKKLTDLPTTPGLAQPVPYQGDSVAVLARPYANTGDPQLSAPKKAWPGPKLPGAYLNPAVKIGCVVVTGAQTKTVVSAAKTASQITPWTAGYATWQLTFRPLLPDEAKGCAALKSNNR